MFWLMGDIQMGGGWSKITYQLRNSKEPMDKLLSLERV